MRRCVFITTVVLLSVYAATVAGFNPSCNINPANAFDSPVSKDFISTLKVGLDFWSHIKVRC